MIRKLEAFISVVCQDYEGKKDLIKKYDKKIKIKKEKEPT